VKGSVAVLEHGSRSDELAHSGLVAHDVAAAPLGWSEWPEFGAQADLPPSPYGTTTLGRQLTSGPQLVLSPAATRPPPGSGAISALRPGSRSCADASARWQFGPSAMNLRLGLRLTFVWFQRMRQEVLVDAE
jgi:hypothetical protein